MRAIEAAGADVVHVDVMDGRFVPNITIGPLVVEAVRKVTPLPLDVHLMIVEPERYVDAFARAGARASASPRSSRTFSVQRRRPRRLRRARGPRLGEGVDGHGRPPGSSRCKASSRGPSAVAGWMSPRSRSCAPSE